MCVVVPCYHIGTKELSYIFEHNFRDYNLEEELRNEFTEIVISSRIGFGGTNTQFFRFCTKAIRSKLQALGLQYHWAEVFDNDSQINDWRLVVHIDFETEEQAVIYKMFCVG